MPSLIAGHDEAIALLDGRFRGFVTIRTDLERPSYSLTVRVPFGDRSVYTAIAEGPDGSVLAWHSWVASESHYLVCENECTEIDLTPF